jgi:hypothetical protein
VQGARWLQLRNCEDATRPEDQARLDELLVASRGGASPAGPGFVPPAPGRRPFDPINPGMHLLAHCPLRSGDAARCQI